MPSTLGILGIPPTLENTTMSARKKTYTVFAVYADNHQRHSTTVEAFSPTGAQINYTKDMSDHEMLIAGVVEGKVMSVDVEDNAEFPSMSDNPRAFA